MSLHGVGGNIAPLTVESANVVAQRNGATGQSFYVYNTFTDSSNYERAAIAWSSNDLIIGTQAAGTGSASRQTHIYGQGQIRFLTGSTPGLRWAIDATGNLIGQVAGTYVLTAPVAVGSLPAAAAGLKGARSFVTDANATTFASIVAAGGANNVPVYCDGTNWRIG